MGINPQDIAILVASIIAQLNPLWATFARALIVTEVLLLLIAGKDCAGATPAPTDPNNRREIEWKCCACVQGSGYCTAEGLRERAGGQKSCSEMCADYGLNRDSQWWNPLYSGYKEIGFCSKAWTNHNYSMCSN